MIMAEDKDDIYFTLRKHSEEYEQWCLAINEYMVMGGNTEELSLDTKTSSKGTKSYKYLGFVITEDKRNRNRYI